jgi:hypothetical protein
MNRTDNLRLHTGNACYCLIYNDNTRTDTSEANATLKMLALETPAAADVLSAVRGAVPLAVESTGALVTGGLDTGALDSGRMLLVGECVGGTGAAMGCPVRTPPPRIMVGESEATDPLPPNGAAVGASGVLGMMDTFWPMTPPPMAPTGAADADGLLVPPI